MQKPFDHRVSAVWIAAALAGAASLSAFAQAPSTPPADAAGLLVYIGTYTGAKSKGIYVSRLDLKSGSLGTPELAAETPSPSFLAVHPTRPFLYAVNEVNTFAGKATGSVSAFSIDRATGRLTPLNQESSGGTGPAHLSVDAAGRNVLVANYGGGSVSVLPLDAQGRLQPSSAFVQHTGSSVNPQRQKEPHAHAIVVDAADRFAYVPDLGLDKIMIYRFGPAKGTLAPATPPFAAVAPGSGPRHIALHPRRPYAYVINEILCTVTAFSRDAAGGGLTELQTLSSLPPGQTVQAGYSTAEIIVHPSGRFVYGSNRGHNSLSAFAVDDKTGILTFIENQPTQGRTPRGFNIDPSGTFLIAGNQQSDSVVVFRIDPQTGRLTPTGQAIEVGAPVSIAFVPVR